jgi:tripartite-type tricarboxylate transporter receptor subunit TctC
VKDPDIISVLANAGLNVSYKSPEEMDKTFQEDYRRMVDLWAKTFKK